MWESFPKLSFRLIWGESYKTWAKQSFLCLVVNNPHTLCTELKLIHQHLCTAPTWSTRKHQQLKANFKDQFSLFLISKKKWSTTWSYSFWFCKHNEYNEELKNASNQRRSTVPCVSTKDVTMKVFVFGDFIPKRLKKWTNQAANHCGSEYDLQRQKSPNKSKTKPRVKDCSGANQGTEI